MRRPGQYPLRRRRGEARRGRGGVLTARDLATLELVGRVGYLSTTQVARALFPNADRASRRLRSLLDLSAISVTYRDSREPNLVALSRHGLSILASHLPDVSGLRLPGPIRATGIAHHLAVVDARLAVVWWIEQWPGAVLRHWHGPHAAASVTRFSPFHLEPDGLVLVDLDGRPATISIEVDRGTEGRRTLSTKLSRHHAAYVAAAFDECWWFIEQRPRIDVLADLVLAADLGSVTRLMHLADVRRRPPGALAPLVIHREDQKTVDRRDANRLARSRLGASEADVVRGTVRRGDR